MAIPVIPDIRTLLSDEFLGVDAYAWTDEEMTAFFDKVWSCVEEIDLAAEFFFNEEYSDSRLKLQEWERMAGRNLKDVLIKRFEEKYP
jgi:hypothetical protein